MYKYIAKLKDGLKYDHELETFLKKNQIVVERQLKTLNLLIITSKKPVMKNDFNCFATVEKDNNDFSI